MVDSRIGAVTTQDRPTASCIARKWGNKQTRHWCSCVKKTQEPTKRTLNRQSSPGQQHVYNSIGLTQVQEKKKKAQKTNKTTTKTLWFHTDINKWIINKGKVINTHPMKNKSIYKDIPLPEQGVITPHA